MQIIPLFSLITLLSAYDAHGQSIEKDTRPAVAPDLRDEETDLKLQRGDFVAVPIPLSSPTFGSGLIAGAAYFYPQTEEQKAAQPASLTALGGAYTDSDSKALVLAQQNYWNNNNWRFTGAVAAADFRLSLLAPDNADESRLDWRVKGHAVFARVSAQVMPKWYAGLRVRFADVTQSLESGQGDNNRSLSFLPDIRTAGLGAYMEFDTRDMPTNAYAGQYFKFDTLFNSDALGGNNDYQNYDAFFNSYHRVADPLVLAWQVRGCLRSGETPLWDGCSIKLRGFPGTDYLGSASASAQVEARWQLSPRWGLVGFAGTGYSRDAYAEQNDREWVPSYGAGIRFMVLKSKRINLRVDYARSNDNDSIHILVGEAF